MSWKSKILPYAAGIGFPVLLAGASYKAVDGELRNNGPFIDSNAYEFVQHMPTSLKVGLLGLSVMNGIAAGFATRAAIERRDLYKKLCGE